MNEMMESIVDRIIENEFNYVLNEDLKDMKDLKEHEVISNKCEELYSILKNNLPKEFHGLLEEFHSKKSYLTCLEIRYFFRKGVIYGIRLQSLKEI